MLIQRILAWLDQVLHSILRLEQHGHLPGWEGAAREEHFWLFGPRCALVREDGHMEIGGIFEVVHRYDEMGRLLLRRSRWKLRRQPGDRMLFDDMEITIAYRTRPVIPGSGITD